MFAVKTNEQTGDGKSIYRTLKHTAKVPIERHQKIKSDANPYDPQWEQYFEQRAMRRMTKSISGRKRIANLWMSQQGRCLVCGQPLEIGNLQTHHLIERCNGGKEITSNEVLLHDTSHKQVHSQGIKLEKPGPWQRGPY